MPTQNRLKNLFQSTTASDMELKFKVQGHTQLARNLRLFAKDISDFRDFFSEALDIIQERSDELFEASGSNVQKANTWAPLAASTIKARQKGWGYYSRPSNNPSVLRWTGNLQSNRTITITTAKGMLTFNAPYAAYHQQGGGKLPRRVIVDLSNPVNKMIVSSLQKIINQKIGIFGRQA